MHRNLLFVLACYFLIAGSCSPPEGAQQHVTYTEPGDPHPVSDSVWAKVPYGLHATFVSPDAHFIRSAPPEQRQRFGNWQTIALRGERVHTQALLWASEGVDNVRLHVGDLLHESGRIIPAEHIQANFTRYVLTDDIELDRLKNGCGIPAGLDSLLVADVLDPATNLALEPNSARPVWLRVDVPVNTEPGQYRGELKISADGQEDIILPYAVDIVAHVLPPAEDWEFHLDLWQNPFSIARYYDLEPWSDQHLEALRPYMQLLADAGQKSITASIIHDPWNGQTYDVYQSMVKWTKRANGTWEYDYTNFDKWVTFMMDLGIDKFINCYSMIPWNERFYYYDETLGKDTSLIASPNSDEYRRHWLPMLIDFARHLKAKGWWEKTTIAMDERPMKAMQNALGVIKAADSGFKVSLAGAFHPELADVLVDYCVASGEQIDTSILLRRQEKGYTTTFYTCCVEARPNTFTQSPYAEATWLAWHALHKGYDGYLRWAYNCWNANPLQDTRYGSWPGGDTWLVYPGARSSVRFERLREGIQDYEKARILISKLTDAGRGDELSELKAAIAHFELGALDSIPAAEAVNRAKALLNSL